MVTNHTGIPKPAELIFSRSQNLPTDWQFALVSCTKDAILMTLAKEIESQLLNREYQSLRKYPKSLQDKIIDFIVAAEKIGINCLGYPEKRIVPDLICKVADIASRKITIETLVNEMMIQNSSLESRVIPIEEQEETTSAIKGDTCNRTVNILMLYHLNNEQVLKIAKIIADWSTAIWNYNSTDNGYGDAWKNPVQSNTPPEIQHESFMDKLRAAGLDEKSVQITYSKLVIDKNIYFFENGYQKLVDKRKARLAA